MQRRRNLTRDEVQEALLETKRSLNYPYIATVTGHYHNPRRTRFLDNVEGLAHLTNDTMIKIVANGPKSEQTAAYVAGLKTALEEFEATHLGGGLTAGGRERMVLGEWSDKP